MTTIRALAIATLALLGACAHDDCGSEGPLENEVVGIRLLPDVGTELSAVPIDAGEFPDPPWGDLDWREEGDVILAGLEGDEPDLLAARGAFVGGMLLRRTRGLGDLAVEARDSGTNGRVLEISGDEVARGAARKLLEGLKGSRDLLNFEFELVDEESGETALGPMSLSVLAGQTASFSILNEIAYVKDFDVEISSAAFIADPIIDVLSEGVVIVFRPFLDPGGRVELALEVTTSAVQRPIREFTTNLADGEDVTLQIPELEIRTKRSALVLPAETDELRVDGIEMPRSAGNETFEVDRLRLEGRVRR